MKKNGFTLIEILISAAILSMILGSLFMVFVGGEGTFSSGEARIQLQENLRQGINLMTRELRQTSPANVIEILASGVRFKVVVSYTSGVANWGADGVTGNMIKYEREGSQIVRRVFNSGGVQQGALRVVANNIAAFTVARNVDRITLSLTAQKNTYQGRTLTISDQIEVVARNG